MNFHANNEMIKPQQELEQGAGVGAGVGAGAGAGPGLEQKHEDELEYELEDDLEDEGEEYNSSDKWRYSIYSAIMFLIISSPCAYITVNHLLGSLAKISSPTGCPTMIGLLVHTVVFTLIIRGMMELDI